MKRLGALFVMLVGLCAGAALAAQETLTDIVPLRGGYSIRVPQGWESRDGLNDGVIITDGARFLYVMDPSVVAAAIDLSRSRVPQDILSRLFEIQYRAPANFDRIREIALDEAPALLYPYGISDNYAGAFVLVELEASRYALFDLAVPADDSLDAIDFIAQIALTLTQDAQPTPRAAATVTPCLLATSATDRVAVRVGPGDDRAIILFMPVGRTYRANGQFTDEDGALWLRVSRTQLAPAVAADELWVSARDVTTTGDCAILTQVGSREIIAAAPPITAISAGGRPPTSFSAAVPADPAAVVGIIPRGGAWTLAFDTTAYQSCRGGDQQSATTTTPTSQVLGDFARGYTSAITVAADGRSFSYYGTTYTLQQGGIYIGGQAFGDGVSQTTRLRPLSETQMTGEYTINVPGDSFACSITIYLSVRRG
jgi:hypothetical protein